MTFPIVPIKKYDEIRHEIRSGDILLCSGNSIFSRLIQQATQSVWSHVGFVLCVEAIDRIMVLESVESVGVRSVPLRHYVNDYNATRVGYPGRLLLARHLDVKAEKINSLSTRAVDYLGLPYGTEEIVRIASRISLNAMGVTQHAMIMDPEREFICSEYAHVCFESIGITINYNRLGFIAPADFANHPRIKPLYYIEVEKLKTLPLPFRHAIAS